MKNKQSFAREQIFWINTIEYTLEQSYILLAFHKSDVRVQSKHNKKLYLINLI